ncbi:bumetanide-sensitive sodium-(potassium)-chloride cotransporter [Caerostris extrusa]|uniref:Bumetanide-sensitive sodium-(Potassium)-chloride cotransporter n=1 Tax=Caerostris extrusa TaxID=172846 RepID=A0AAV4P007_CAEEX|nr:bumetanide-sensitive sodium-(potassium)-chloride cotransporter [Caerostris extrusa]
MDAHMSLCILRIPGGTDYSAYFDTPDGLPILQNYHPKEKLDTIQKLPDLKVTLETVLEESVTSDGVPPPYKIVSADEARDHLKRADLFHEKQEKGNIDVWWLYDDGGLTLLDEQRNLSALLSKFRIPFEDLTVISAEGEPLHEESTQTFKRMISKFLSKDESQKDPATVTRSTLNTFKNRTNQFLRLRELVEKYSKSSNLIVMTLPLPRRDGPTAPLYLTLAGHTDERFAAVSTRQRKQTSVLTFYS